jgi:AcrR family transcriptional regulator
MRAARRALLTGGPGAVRVEPLAAQLNVTKGSFYWHFADRAALLEALLVEWEEEFSMAVNALPDTHAGEPDARRALLEFLAPRVISSERGGTPSDAAIFAWAASDPQVAGRVNAAEAKRIALVQHVVGDRDLGEFLYLTYVGFIMRRRRLPKAAAFFTTFARLSERIAASFVSGSTSVVERRGNP